MLFDITWEFPEVTEETPPLLSAKIAPVQEMIAICGEAVEFRDSVS